MPEEDVLKFASIVNACQNGERVHHVRGEEANRRGGERVKSAQRRRGEGAKRDYYQECLFMFTVRRCEQATRRSVRKDWRLYEHKVSSKLCYSIILTNTIRCATYATWGGECASECVSKFFVFQFL